MKRVLVLCLSLVMLLTLLPVSVSAGGGGAGLYHEFDFDTVSEYLQWTVIDANGDGYSFDRCRDDGCDVRSGQYLGGDGPLFTSSDDYLISPPVYLREGQEYTLYYRVGGERGNYAYSPNYEVYVYTGGEELSAANLYTELGQRARLHWFSGNGWDDYTQMDLTAYAGQSVRIVFRVNSLYTACLWLDDVCIYWQEPDELLSKVTATNVPMPAVGVNVKDLHESDIRFPSFANYSLVPGSMTWYKTVNEQMIPMTDEVFTADGEYDMRFRVRPKSGITATDTGVASVNGEFAWFRPQEDGTVLVDYIPNHRYGEAKEVRDVHIRLDEPQPGAWPDTVAERWMPDGSQDFHWRITDIDWSPLEIPFQQDGTYTVKLTLAPEPGYDFADFVHVTLNGEPMRLEPGDYGPTISKTYTFIEPSEVLVTFNANGHGTPPAPLAVPYGGCIWDVIDDYSEVDLPDIDGMSLYNWSDSPDAGKSDYFSFSTELYEDTTLYAIWLDTVDELELWLDPPAPGDSVSEMLLRADRYDDVSVSYFCWFTDENHTNRAASFEPGETYYGVALLVLGDYGWFGNDPKLHLHGANQEQFEAGGDTAWVTFNVTMPQRFTTVDSFQIWVDTPVTGAGMDMTPAIYCLTPGLSVVPEGDWWDSRAAVGDYDHIWGGGFRPGMTLYTIVDVSSEEYALAAVDSLSVETFGASFCGFDGYTVNNGVRAILSVKVTDAYCFTVWAEGPGRFYFSGELGLTGLCDFAYVRPGDYTLTAYPEENCTFVGWYDGDKLLTKNRTYAFTLKDHVEHWRAVFTETEVTRIDVSVPIPEIGDEFGYYYDTAGAVVTNGAPVTLQKNAWYTSWGVSGSPLPFFKGWSYFVELDFVAKPGAYLSENTQVYINGEPAATWRQANSMVWFAASRNYAMNPFVDVIEGKYYFDAVMWAISREPPVTSGKDETHFAPKETCTRGQVVTFLWNAMGQPEPSITDCPFVDVKPGKYYYDAMLWALETGVTSGKDDTHFAPNETCTRAQVVTFLWNAMGKPDPKSEDCPFVDVKPGKFYYRAMLWAYHAGVTSGKDETHFAPNETCTRGQVVTFLYNAMSK